ncbi:uncharacterized protein PGRI_056670 [Penicillium griseofulvum]|uniref:Uncharacterized protein n=1 Tax=Penicillium patulum TaxID=5078 RepID=A0A135LL75_PENPA|nr:uncharacterized protein PGRI_056670 [Penicillium griseofulvum]KXG49699.1 hypothetical protein PGRI_056670 [Penicillium griseofulvum]
MAGRLALVILYSVQILALPTPNENQIASKSLASTTHDKRYYFPETLPDQDELEAMLKETMREAGFIPSSKPVTESEHKTNTELRYALPNTDAVIGTATPATPAYTQDTKLSQSQSILKEPIMAILGSDGYPTYWPPFGFFVISAAIVCFFTVLRGIRAK